MGSAFLGSRNEFKSDHQEGPTGSRGFFEILSGKGKGFEELLALRQEKQRSKDGMRARITKGKVTKMLKVPEGIPLPPYAISGVNPPMNDTYATHDAEGIEKMRASSKLAKEVLEMAGNMVKPGITTNDIDLAVHKMTIEAGAYPSPLNYGKFPKSVCTSLNEVICHGIPDTTVLQDGDIINIDVTVYLNGYHGDTSRMFLVGKNVSKDARHLVTSTEEALERAIAVCKPGVRFNQIGKAIHDYADKQKLGVVRSFVGHGVGSVFHCGPAVLHYRNNERGVMQVGQTFTIEPMLTLGATRERYWDDDWTAVTSDGSWTAQCEHTLLITETGVDILTAYK
ncbi:hypothetical protein CYMTET_34501 [Cymbomonas tetramitiformis]|uniref:Methionine aminopeptidase n=1 Tax=Cymbomonas tetramitiformis TaxID=36881 RepID=A0AAE0FB36_9CHLO|nr:hypothetical protein CYMTET_34501 [Cymbomonas tetramitiformis]